AVHRTPVADEGRIVVARVEDEITVKRLRRAGQRFRLDAENPAYAPIFVDPEREAFAIEALLALERADEAERRYYDFRRAFPQSDFTSRLERAMQRPRHEVGEHGR
ncbi:MAG: hypothetical protein K8H88_28870, partial [Sandaracinaceae bacterium]|nr:hypothetical protein [Sandaracinaceae bacterium]